MELELAEIVKKVIIRRVMDTSPLYRHPPPPPLFFLGQEITVLISSVMLRSNA